MPGSLHWLEAATLEKQDLSKWKPSDVAESLPHRCTCVFALGSSGLEERAWGTPNRLKLVMGKSWLRPMALLLPIGMHLSLRGASVFHGGKVRAFPGQPTLQTAVVEQHRSLWCPLHIARHMSCGKQTFPARRAVPQVPQHGSAGRAQRCGVWAATEAEVAVAPPPPRRHAKLCLESSRTDGSEGCVPRRHHRSSKPIDHGHHPRRALPQCMRHLVACLLDLDADTGVAGTVYRATAPGALIYGSDRPAHHTGLLGVLQTALLRGLASLTAEPLRGKKEGRMALLVLSCGCFTRLWRDCARAPRWPGLPGPDPQRT